MNVSRTTLVFCAVAIAVSLGCVKLGFWQLARLNERRGTNELITARLGEVAVPFERIPATTGVKFRRVFANGRYDFSNEFVLTSRSRMGAPGVNIITPMKTGRGDSAVLVN